MLSRFEEFADHERLAAIDGVVCFDLVRASGPNECHTVRFHGGAVDLLDGGARPDVTIGAAIVDFVRLVTGQRNAALLYLADRVVLTGDEMLALAVGTVFRVPGTDRAAVDPTALDAMDVASAVASTSREHMGEVMANGFRGIVLGEVFRRFPDFLDPERASKLKLSVGFRIGGPETPSRTGTSCTSIMALAASRRACTKEARGRPPSASTGSTSCVWSERQRPGSGVRREGQAPLADLPRAGQHLLRDHDPRRLVRQLAGGRGRGLPGPAPARRGVAPS